METLTDAETQVEVRQRPAAVSMAVKTLGTLLLVSYTAGVTGNLWLTLMVAVGWPATHYVVWRISEQTKRVERTPGK